ncbi:DUF4097 family beta strand repeat-containing protein [Emticicia sp. 21SJ11W-3]|uniref:DUF4097 family beta strand repeat-containing protein n=1 Tax=Emticicia sp. 21SJ11W-3 TaxID=2916755 RepID=UPI00209F3570|nr:DUF4097 family beta strand repeat-containing protein [Emticicia sp. 21SJ11W-3]UTA67688.1 DUF4097 domain-containing protein [Emticicia sp. 21SJ11W-3]
MKKHMLIFACLFLTALYTQAQEYKHKLANNASSKIAIELDADNLKIEGHAGDEVIIRGGSTEILPEQAKGLKALYNTNVDNTGIGLSVTSEGGILKIEKASRKSAKYTILIPNKASLIYTQINWQGSWIAINNVEGDLEMKTNNADMKLNNVTGPIVASSISGNFTAVFKNVNQSKPCAISLVSGEIDLTLPSTTKASVLVKSVTGEVYSDLDMNLKPGKDGLPKVSGGHNIAGTLNGGGVNLNLNSVSGNIYLRKQK